MTPPSSSDSKPLSFRLGGSLLKRLQELAEANGRTEGIEAKELLTNVLEHGFDEGQADSQLAEQVLRTHEALLDVRTQLDEHQGEALSEVRRVEQQVAGLRRDLSTVLELLLLNLTDLEKDEVRSFVTQNLRK